MSERIHVLLAILGLAGSEFTVFDIAEKTGVNVATVRTVLGRERRFVRELGRSEGESRGGRAIKYGLDETAVSELRKEVSDLREAFIGGESDKSSELRSLEPPSLIAAQDILSRQLPKAEDNDEKTELLQAANRYLSVTWQTIQCMREGSPDLWRLKILTMGLEQHVREIALKIHDFPYAATTKLSGPDPVVLFEESIRNACAKYDLSDPSHYSVQVLVEAAAYFDAHAAGSQPSSTAVESIATGIRRSLNPKFEMHDLIVLGRVPAAYQKGVVRLNEKAGHRTIAVNSHPFIVECQRFKLRTDAHNYPLQSILASVR
jgi:hypothetical protein